MDCRAVQDALVEALYGALPAARQVAAHCQACPSCAAAWEALQRTAALLAQWPDEPPPAAVRQRVLAQVRALAAAGRRPWWQGGLARTALAVGAGLALLVLTVLVLAPWLPLDAVTPRLLLLCGALWGGAYIGLCRLAFASQEEGLAVAAAQLALLALAVATLLLAAARALGLAAWLPAAGPALFGGGLALVALGVSSGCSGRWLAVRSAVQALLAACFFLLAVAPGLLMFCVPFTLGAYAGLLLAVGCGAGAGVLGGALAQGGIWRHGRE